MKRPLLIGSFLGIIGFNGLIYEMPFVHFIGFNSMLSTNN